MTREQAISLLKKYNDSEALIHHAKAVEAVMRAFAKHYGEDEDYWGNVGLLHDLDYEKWPEEHCKKTEEILREENAPDDFIRAIVSHGWNICTDVEPKLQMEKTLYTIDELCGLINATALMRPTKLEGMKVKSVKKKFKSPSFAAGVNRQVIEEGSKMMGMDLSEITQIAIDAMRENSSEVGL